MCRSKRNGLKRKVGRLKRDRGSILVAAMMVLKVVWMVETGGRERKEIGKKLVECTKNCNGMLNSPSAEAQCSSDDCLQSTTRFFRVRGTVLGAYLSCFCFVFHKIDNYQFPLSFGICGALYEKSSEYIYFHTI